MTVIETLTSREIPDNIRLAAEVGWPDDEADWRVVHEAAVVLGARKEGRLIGQGALGLYDGQAGTIAKMVVSPSAQRQGVGAAILDALLVEADRRGLAAVGLVATPSGQPLYESRGFVVTGHVAVFIGTPTPDPALVSERVIELTKVEPALALDRRFISCSRAGMLRGRFNEARVGALHGSPAGDPRGFALANGKGEYALVGPVIADDEAVARALTRVIFKACNGAVRIDVPAEHTAFRDWLRSLGLPEKGVRPEMARGGALPWQVPQRFALATAAWG
jgi:GNAT superfamily N-acetyltransferase